MDFKTVLLEDPTIADITSEIVLGVESGALNTNYQQFAANSNSNSVVSYNIRLPSVNDIADRHVLTSQTINLTIKTRPVEAGDIITVFTNKTGAPFTSFFSYGFTDSFQSFPAMKCFTNVQCSMDGANFSTQLQDVIDPILKMNDIRELNRYNSTCPSLPDQIVGQYNGVSGFAYAGSNVNVMGSVNNASQDADFMPRGAFGLDAYVTMLCNADGTMATDGLDATGNVTASGYNAVYAVSAGQYWTIWLKATTIEPIGIALAPFVNTKPFSSGGLLGVNQLNLIFSIDSSLKRIWSSSGYQLESQTVNNVVTTIKTKPSILSISPGIVATSGGVSPEGITASTTLFTNPQLLFRFLTMQDSQIAKLDKSQINTLPYFQYERFVTQPNQFGGMLPGSTTTLTNQNISLGLIPDRFICFARPAMSDQNWTDPAGFLKINSVTITFSNASGILSTATPADLYNLSIESGLNQSWYEWGGYVYGNSNVATATPVQVPSLGSLLVLNPAKYFGLPDTLSNGSLGQFNFIIKMSVTNQYGYVVYPELVVIPISSGIMTTCQGSTRVQLGLLTVDKTLDAKNEHAVNQIDASEYERLVGGKMLNRHLTGLHKFAKHLLRKYKEHKGDSGGANSGGAYSGGAYSGGSSYATSQAPSIGKRSNNLSRFYM